MSDDGLDNLRRFFRLVLGHLPRDTVMTDFQTIIESRGYDDTPQDSFLDGLIEQLTTGWSARENAEALVRKQHAKLLEDLADARHEAQHWKGVCDSARWDAKYAGDYLKQLNAAFESFSQPCPPRKP